MYKVNKYNVVYLRLKFIELHLWYASDKLRINRLLLVEKFILIKKYEDKEIIKAIFLF